MKSYADFGFSIPSDATGEVRCVCPKCSPTRKPGNQNERDLAVNATDGTWLCHHCGWTGCLRDVKMPAQKQRKTYQRPQFEQKHETERLSKQAIEWFSKRGISLKTILATGVYTENGVLCFPFFKNGECVNIKSRTHDKKFWQAKDPEPCLYNHDRAQCCEDKTWLIVTEGEMDCLALIESGYDAVVSVPNGAPATTAKEFSKAFEYLELEEEFLAQFKNVVLAVDNDAPGKLLEQELSRRIGQEKCYRVAYPEGCKDCNDVLVKHGVQGVSDVISSVKPFPVKGVYSVSDVKKDVFRLYNEGCRPGLSTGWASVDEYYTVRENELTIVTGIPSHGKSTWLDALCVNLWKNNSWKFCYCSPENWPLERHCASIAEKIVGKSFSDSKYSWERMQEDELSSALEMMDGFFEFVMLDDEDMAIDKILETMRLVIYRTGVNGIILDPWNELEHHRPSGMSETEFVSQALGKIRRFARKNHVHVWIVAHPTKLSKDKDSKKYPVPSLYDISGSAHFYNKTDNGISIYRKFDTDETEVYICKVRFKEIGKVGSATLRFAKESGRYF